MMTFKFISEIACFTVILFANILLLPAIIKSWIHTSSRPIAIKVHSHERTNGYFPGK